MLRLSGEKEGFRGFPPAGGSGGTGFAGFPGKAIRPDTVLVSVMAANNEIGTLQPVAELGAFAGSGASSFTRTLFNGSARSRFRLSTSSMPTWFPSAPTNSTDQKAPGRFISNRRCIRTPILFGGSHENERRAGTENLAGIIGLVEALERFVATPVFDRERLAPLTGRLIQSH